MSVRQGRSAAFTLAIALVAAFIVGALLLTVVDPVVQALFASAMFDSTTQDGFNLLSWLQDTWGFVGAAILIGFLITVWVSTRRPE